MKKTLLLTTILSFFVLVSCKDEKLDPQQNPTIENIKKLNDFFLFERINKGDFISKNNSFYYTISLDAINKTDNIFEKTIVEADLKLVLHNNNVLSVNDTDKVLNIGSIEKITFWKPNQKKAIGKSKELFTQSLPSHFKEYPVKQVVLMLKLTVNDIVNKTEEIVVHNIDITEDWRIFLNQKNLSSPSKTNKKEKNSNQYSKGTKEKSKNDESRLESSKILLNKILSGEKTESVDKTKVNSNLKNSDLSYSVEGRKAISKPLPTYKCNESGKVAVEVVINKEGRTISAKSGVNGTTNQVKCLLEPAKIAALNTLWEASDTAPDEQIGTIYYYFSLN